MNLYFCFFIVLWNKFGINKSFWVVLKIEVRVIILSEEGRVLKVYKENNFLKVKEFKISLCWLVWEVILYLLVIFISLVGWGYDLGVIFRNVIGKSWREKWWFYSYKGVSDLEEKGYLRGVWRKEGKF